MKITTSFIVALFFCASCLIGQVGGRYYFPTGHIAPELTLYEYPTWTSSFLSEHLAQGKTLFLFYFSVVDGVAWDYHNSLALQSFYAEHGSTGESSIEVFYLCLDVTSSALSGVDPDSQGDWLANMPYPVCHGYEFHEVFNQPRRPVLCRICPDGKMDKLPLVSADSLETYIGGCATATVVNDAKILYSDVDTTASCIGQSRAINAYLSNMGTDTLTSVDIVTASGNEVLSTVHWIGSLPPYHHDTVDLAPLITKGYPEVIKLYTKMPNDISDELSSNDTLQIPLDSPIYWDDDKIFVEILTDAYAHQIYWDIKDAGGIKVDSGGNSIVGAYEWLSAAGPGAYPDYTYITDTINLSNLAQECLTIQLKSAYGYGQCCYYGEGYVRFKKGDEVIYEWTNWNWKVFGKIYTTFDLQPLDLLATAQDAINGLANGSINLSASGGKSGYMYSIDCGLTFFEASTFTGLDTGTYCVVVRDTIGQTASDTVMIGNLTGVDAALYGHSSLFVQPNPTKDQILVMLSGVTDATEVKVQLLNAAGQEVLVGTLYQQGSTHQGVLSLSALPSGVYFVRVTAPQMTRVAKVVKSE